MNTLLLDAELQVQNGKWEEAIKMLESASCGIFKELSMLCGCYYVTGQFQQAYLMSKKAKKDYPGDSDELMDQMIEIYESIGLKEYDAPIAIYGDFEQSLERPDESYPESDMLKSMLASARTEKQKARIFDELVSQSYSLTECNREEAFFSLGEMAFRDGDYMAAFEYYNYASKVNPNKALYWGYSANSIDRYTAAVLNAGHDIEECIDYYFISSFFARKAIDLEPGNPRWHFYQGMALKGLVIVNPHFILQSALEYNRAMHLCRGGQTALYNASKQVRANTDSLHELLRKNKAIFFPLPTGI